MLVCTPVRCPEWCAIKLIALYYDVCQSSEEGNRSLYYVRTQRLTYYERSVRPSASQVHYCALRQNTTLTVKQSVLFDNSCITSQTVSLEDTNHTRLHFRSFSTERYKMRLLAAPRVSGLK